MPISFQECLGEKWIKLFPDYKIDDSRVKHKNFFKYYSIWIELLFEDIP